MSSEPSIIPTPRSTPSKWPKSGSVIKGIVWHFVKNPFLICRQEFGEKKKIGMEAVVKLFYKNVPNIFLNVELHILTEKHYFPPVQIMARSRNHFNFKYWSKKYIKYVFTVNRCRASKRQPFLLWYGCLLVCVVVLKKIQPAVLPSATRCHKVS